MPSCKVHSMSAAFVSSLFPFSPFPPLLSSPLAVSLPMECAGPDSNPPPVVMPLTDSVATAGACICHAQWHGIEHRTAAQHTAPQAVLSSQRCLERHYGCRIIA